MGRNTDSVRAFRQDYVVAIAMGLIAAALILTNLGNQYMWGDEAQTALISKTVLAHGVPLGTDGRNCFSTENMAELGKGNTWRWHPWLPFYMVAGSYALFDASTFTSRLPFALLGIATVVIAYLFGKSLWKSQRAGVLSAIALATSVPMLLLVRQCRYYGAASFFVLAAMYAYWEMRKGRRYAGFAFGLSAFFLFHSFYVYLPAMLLAVIVHAWFFGRKEGDASRRCLRQVLLISAIVTIINIPWMVYFSSVTHAPHGDTDLVHRSYTLTTYLLGQIVKHLFPLWLLALPAVIVVTKRRRKEPVSIRGTEVTGIVVMLLTFVIVTIVVLAPTAPFTYLRYLAPAIPIFCLIIGYVLDRSMRLHPAVGLLVLLLLAARENMWGYLYELTHDYDGPVEGISRYLNENARPDDVVAVNHEALPLMFYTNLRIVSGASGEDLTPAKTAEWIILRKHIAENEQKVTSMLVDTAMDCGYDSTVIEYPDIPHENRESPEEHNFRTVEDEEYVTVLRRPEGL